MSQTELRRLATLLAHAGEEWERIELDHHSTAPATEAAWWKLTALGWVELKLRLVSQQGQAVRSAYGIAGGDISDVGDELAEKLGWQPERAIPMAGRITVDGIRAREAIIGGAWPQLDPVRGYVEIISAVSVGTPTSDGEPILTDREREIYDLIPFAPEGIAGKQLASKAGMSENTLTRHIIPKLKPLGVGNRRGLGYFRTRADSA